jgi:hypothetical protein
VWYIHVRRKYFDTTQVRFVLGLLARQKPIFKPKNQADFFMEMNHNLSYLVMPLFVYEDSALNDVSRRVYSFIHTFRGEFFFFSNDHMARMFNCKQQAVSDAVQSLHKLKYIELEYKVKGGGGKTRFIKDLHAYDYSQMTSRTSQKGLVENEATTSHLGLDNDINDNNISKKISDNPVITRKHKEKKSGGFGNSFSPKIQQPYKPFPKKGGFADGKNIV